MSNNAFLFKQFVISQDRCAMKVTTDACLQGAWLPVPAHAKRAIDIGCGTGLLSLMLAQRFPELMIDAVEIDGAAAEQAAQNAVHSRFNTQVKVKHADARQLPLKQEYDLLITNPPFFSQSLKGPELLRNTARHDDSLSMEDLVAIMNNCLNEDGQACILLPQELFLHRRKILESAGWFLHKELICHSNADRQTARNISVWTRAKPDQIISKELIVYDDQHRLTEEAAQLLQPFYLFL